MLSPSTVFLGHPSETIATFLSGFGGSLVTREAVARPTSEAVEAAAAAAATRGVADADAAGAFLVAGFPPWRSAAARIA